MKSTNLKAYTLWLANSDNFISASKFKVQILYIKRTLPMFQLK